MEYRAWGKLLLFGEYMVLKGAKCLAIPVKFGQTLTVIDSDRNDISWESYSNDEIWFAATFSADLKLQTGGDVGTSQLLSHLLRYMRIQKPELFKAGQIFRVDADFPLEWGLGSSATLISLLAQWGEFNPYELLENSLIGSGYDIACATANGPIEYQRKDREVEVVNLNNAITDQLLFVYSGKKQDTSSEVMRFQDCSIEQNMIEEMNRIVGESIAAQNIDAFAHCMEKSEMFLSKILGLPTIKEKLFGDYPHAIKSLGAWGGDFFMAVYYDENEARSYFEQKGYTVQFSFNEIIKNKARQ